VLATILTAGKILISTSVNGALGTGSVTLNNGSTLEISRQNITNSVVVNSGTISGENSFLSTISGPITLNGQLTVDSLSTGSHEFRGIVSGAGGITKTGLNIAGSGLILSGSNTYSGATIISAGILELGSNNVLPNASAVSIGNATLNAGTRTDTMGTLDVTSTATINLGAGAALAFANSSAVDWTGGTLNITGTFVSGASLRFGTNTNGLTRVQLSKISVLGVTSLALDSSGYLIAGYSTWAVTMGIPSVSITNDTDGDGRNNLLEYALNGNPTSAGDTNLPTFTITSNQFKYVHLRRTNDPKLSYTLETKTNLVSGNWTTSTAGTATNPSGVAGFDLITLTLPSTNAQIYIRLKATLNP